MTTGGKKAGDKFPFVAIALIALTLGLWFIVTTYVGDGKPFNQEQYYKDKYGVDSTSRNRVP